MKKGLIIYFDEAEKNDLEAVSHNIKKSQTEIVREAVNAYIINFKNGPKNLSEAVKHMSGMFKQSKINNYREESNKGLQRTINQ
jgi:hypothetical protein